MFPNRIWWIYIIAWISSSFSLLLRLKFLKYHFIGIDVWNNCFWIILFQLLIWQVFVLNFSWWSNIFLHLNFNAILFEWILKVKVDFDDSLLLLNLLNTLILDSKLMSSDMIQRLDLLLVIRVKIVQKLLYSILSWFYLTEIILWIKVSSKFD